MIEEVREWLERDGLMEGDFDRDSLNFLYVRKVWRYVGRQTVIRQ